jgi:CheY-like chemotaxis protein
VEASRPIVLICDEDRAHTYVLAEALDELGWSVELTRSYAEAFALACALDLSGLVCAPFLRDGSALALPASLGIRRPPTIVLASRMHERISETVARRAGFDAQLAKVVEVRKLDRLLRLAKSRPAEEIAARERSAPGPR